MQRSRFWFGVGLGAVPVLLAALLLSPALHLTSNGPVEGWVSYHGQPLAGGSILFVPDDPRHCEWAHAWLDEKGHYVIGSGWQRDGSDGKTRYRICVIPNSHQLASKLGSNRGVGLSSGELSSAWWGLGEVAFPAPGAGTGFPPRLSNPTTTQLQVQIGSEPSRVDVAL
jgi:hypothetical protein